MKWHVLRDGIRPWQTIALAVSACVLIAGVSNYAISRGGGHDGGSGHDSNAHETFDNPAGNHQDWCAIDPTCNGWYRKQAIIARGGPDADCLIATNDIQRCSSLWRQAHVQRPRYQVAQVRPRPRIEYERPNRDFQEKAPGPKRITPGLLLPRQQDQIAPSRWDPPPPPSEIGRQSMAQNGNPFCGLLPFCH
jgi:hypothetical protein